MRCYMCAQDVPYVTEWWDGREVRCCMRCGTPLTVPTMAKAIDDFAQALREVGRACLGTRIGKAIERLLRACATVVKASKLGR
jgi:hypothetical protein